MATKVSNVILSVRQAIQDILAVRWTDTSLLDYLNEAQVEITRYKPDAFIKNVPLTMAVGIAQALPSDAIRMIDVVCNSLGPAVIQTDRRGLNIQNPTWTQEPGSAIIKAFMFHDSDPTRFYVYPPATASATLMVVYSARPTDATISGDITLGDEFKSSIVHYICFKAFNEDGMSPDTNKASNFHGLFLNSLKLSEEADKTVEPKIYLNGK